MATVSYTCHIQASPQVVYDASQDYERRYEWDPLPERIEFVDGSHTVEVGSRVRVIAKSRICIDVEFIQVSPPTRIAVNMVRGPAYLDTFAGSWIFKPGDDGTSATFKYAIKSKRWAIPIIADNVAKWYFSRVVRARLDALKVFCESAEPSS